MTPHEGRDGRAQGSSVSRPSEAREYLPGVPCGHLEKLCPEVAFSAHSFFYKLLKIRKATHCLP